MLLECPNGTRTAKLSALSRARPYGRARRQDSHTSHPYVRRQTGWQVPFYWALPKTGMGTHANAKTSPPPPPLGTNLPSTIVWPTGALSKRLSHAHARARTGARMNACSARTVLGKAAQRSGSKQPGKAAYYKKDVGIAALFPFRRRDTRAPMRARACPYVSPWNQRTMT